MQPLSTQKGSQSSIQSKQTKKTTHFHFNHISHRIPSFSREARAFSNWHR